MVYNMGMGERMILGIDPGGSKPHAISLFRNGVYSKVYFNNNIKIMSLHIRNAYKVYIESQYYGGNASTLILLSQRTGMIMGLCELYNIPYEMVAPISWQSHFKIPNRRPKDLTPYKWKNLHMQYIVDKARELTDYKGTDVDESAAILIGLYGVQNDR